MNLDNICKQVYVKELSSKILAAEEEILAILKKLEEETGTSVYKISSVYVPPIQEGVGRAKIIRVDIDVNIPH